MVAATGLVQVPLGSVRQHPLTPPVVCGTSVLAVSTQLMHLLAYVGKSSFSPGPQTLQSSWHLQLFRVDSGNGTTALWTQPSVIGAAIVD